MAAQDRQPDISAFFDEPTNTVTYLVSDPLSRRAIVIDPVLDYEVRAARVSAKSATALLDHAAGAGLVIDYVLETHAHADHLSAAAYIQAKSGAQIAIGEHIGETQRTFRARFNIPEVSDTGREFDRLLKDGERLAFGDQTIEVLYTPGHTSACVSYRVGDAVFVGDTLFMPDYGTARTDFPGGDARTLYRSIRRLLALPPETRLFMCHDYKAPGRETYAWQSTVAEQRARNVHIHDGVSEADFVALRKARDATLAAPALILPAIQVNIRGGRFPAPEGNGTRYLKLPVSFVDDASRAAG